MALLPEDLELWFSDRFDHVLTKPEPYEGDDALLHEVWLFDTEVANGGPAQYFGNFPERWPLLLAAVEGRLPEFAPVAGAVGAVIAGTDDPFEAMLAAEATIEPVYDAHREAILTSLRDLVRTQP